MLITNMLKHIVNDLQWFRGEPSRRIERSKAIKLSGAVERLEQMDR